MPLICFGGKLGFYHMNCCWTSSLLLPAFLLSVWTQDWVLQASPAGWAGLHWVLWLMLPQEIGCLVFCPYHFHQTHQCLLVRSMTVTCELLQGGLQTTSYQVFSTPSGPLSGMGSASEGLVVLLVYVLGASQDEEQTSHHGPEGDS